MNKNNNAICSYEEGGGLRWERQWLRKRGSKWSR